MANRNDELNNVSSGSPKTSDKPKKKKGIPFEEYFGVMELSDEEINGRVLMALDMEDAVMYLFGALGEETSRQFLVNTLYADLLDAYGKYGEIDEYVEELALQYANDIVDGNIKHPGDEYYTSEDRAMFCAEDMANSFYNYIDYVDATKNYKYKTWHSQGDRYVRDAHRDLDGIKIPFDETFKVGGNLMRFPKDVFYGATADQIINCRCWLTYS